MGWLEDIENFWRRLFEGIFQRGKEQPLHPVQIAKALVRVMLDSRSISVNKVYVPNIYLVYLSPRDFENLSMYKKALASELAEYLRERASAQNYTLVGDIKVLWELDEELPPGGLRVHARMEEQWASPSPEDTLVYPPVKEGVSVPSRRPEFRLLVVEGPDQGRTFVLHEGRQVLGRNPTCEVFLTDDQVSRQHCQIEVEEGKSILTDLGSRNGTLVNGQPVQRALLNPGDHIQVGRTLLQVQVVGQ
ncbi:FHA domain-containing protein [Thermanaeromonas toyohensis ToBE]|uniref:FHA domain-containing protein n=1 Tax=Thermanaeromonas toyohensis ToBE TaxID=698762 RepID=A0A1W1VMU4_9FIRM|nr:DUF3662 and FHA domain-containing protein [Thermanaeromonas toyohensis]SMB94648.1 FHA domain-containing protein [Thermanaeromonas toyohensis ToBE]